MALRPQPSLTLTAICRRCYEAIGDSLELDRSLPYDRGLKLSHRKLMPTDAYNYELIAQHPKLLALYSGWIGQKISFLAHSAVTLDQPNLWSAAAPEMDRLVLLLHYATKAKILKLSDKPGAVLGELIGYFAAGGWWTSQGGTRERAAYHRNRREPDEFHDHEPGPSDAGPRHGLARQSRQLGRRDRLRHRQRRLRRARSDERRLGESVRRQNGHNPQAGHACQVGAGAGRPQ